MKRRVRCGCECAWEWGGSEGEKKESIHTKFGMCTRPSGHFPGAWGGGGTRMYIRRHTLEGFKGHFLRHKAFTLSFNDKCPFYSKYKVKLMEKGNAMFRVMVFLKITL